MSNLLCQVFAQILPPTSGSLTLAHEGMAHDREIVALILGLVAILMALRYRTQLASVPGIKWWVAALMARLLSWALSIFEAFVWHDVGTLLEQLLLTASTVLIGIGCWSMYRTKAREYSA